MRIELKGAVAYHHVVAMLEFVKRVRQLSSAEITERTDDVAPYIHKKSFRHAVIVPQSAVQNPSGIIALAVQARGPIMDA